MLEKRKEELVPLMEKALAAFLDAHQGERYYCFALDCNAAYAEINLCLNTEEAFAGFLRRYRESPCAGPSESPQDQLDLRYNTGNWDYQCFETFYALEEERLQALYGEDEEALLRDMMAFNHDLLRRLLATDAFRRIPKTDDFRVLCIDHDEDVAEALDRTARYVSS